VVKFIEVGRVSPTSFTETFTMVIDTLRQSLKPGSKGKGDKGGKLEETTIFSVSAPVFRLPRLRYREKPGFRRPGALRIIYGQRK